jgi:hypothetical protein
MILNGMVSQSVLVLSMMQELTNLPSLAIHLQAQ